MLLQGDSVERQAGLEAAKASAALVGLTRGWGQGQGYRRGSAMGSSAQHFGARIHVYQPSTSTSHPWYLSVHSL